MGAFDFLGIGKAIKDATDGIGKNTTDIINAAKGQVPPEQMVQLEQLKSDTMTKLEALKQTGDEAFQQFILQYEGDAKSLPKWIVTLRALIRPVITSVMFIQLSVAISIDFFKLAFQHMSADDMILNHLPSGYWVIQSIIVGFWFGGKAGERIAEAFSKRK